MNANDPKEVKEAAKKERRSRDQELRDIHYLLQTSTGRRWMWRLLEFCGEFQLSYTRGDTHETSFREGMRNVGNKVLADIMDANGNIYGQMREENTEEVEENGTSQSGRDEDGTSKDGAS